MEEGWTLPNCSRWQESEIDLLRQFSESLMDEGLVMALCGLIRLGDGSMWPHKAW